MSIKRYPKYQTTDAPWLSEVPSHWRVERLKYSISSCRNGIWGSDPQGNEDDIPCVRVADFDRNRMRVQLSDPTVRNVLPNERRGRVLQRGNLLLEKSGGGDLQPVGFVVLYDDASAAVCSNFVAKVELAPGMDPGFWRYLHFAIYAARVNTRSINQTSGIQNLDQDRYFNELSPFPPLEEQRAIASFVDRATREIDALVVEQERLIELLEEKRQTVISHAVTKGLDPTVSMKESGTDWLGEVPSHWRIERLKYSIVSCRNGIWGSEPLGNEDDIPCVRVADFDRILMRVQLSNPTIRNVLSNEQKGRVLVRGNLLLEKSGGGDLQPVGFVVLYDDASAAVCSNFVAKAELAPGMDPSFWRYLHFAIYAAGVNTRSINQTSGIQNLDQHRYFNELVPFPPLTEQLMIAAFIDASTQEIDALVAEASHVITLLRERRSAMISAAVTGQIDVSQLEAA
jgi:type I restriction enzyme S subunit